MAARDAAGALLLSAAAGLAASCGSDSPVEPAAVDVRVANVSRLPAGCPDGVREGLPAGATAALEFTVTGSGAIRR